MKMTNCSLVEHFSNLEDPRIDQKKLHLLIDIIVLSICGVMCGASDWEEIEEIGKAKFEDFKTILELPNGIPSHDTIGRVFARLDPKELESCFNSWVQSLRTSGEAREESSERETVGIDGKTLRRSFERGLKSINKKAIHMVSAWASRAGMVLGQVKTEEKSNEITAIPELLRVLELSGNIVTIDAMGCQKSIARNRPGCDVYA